MRTIFKNFHNPSEAEISEIWKSQNTLIAFDTNVFLNLYSYTKQTREDFFKVLDKVKGQIWIPYHVGLEYQRRRLHVVSTEKAVFGKIDKNLDKISNVFKKDFNDLALKRRFPDLQSQTEKLEKDIDKLIEKYKTSVKEWDKQQACVRSHDEIRNQLNHYFDERVGPEPKSQEDLDNTFAEGKQRFENKIPPGFEDSDKEYQDDAVFYNQGLKYERQYGDLLIWLQLIEKAKDESIHNVIFVTDDKKPDWWFSIQSNGKKIVGPLAELQAEIYKKSNINKFHMYDTPTFMKDGTSELNVNIDKRSILDAESSKPIATLAPKAKSVNFHFDVDTNTVIKEFLYEDGSTRIDVKPTNSSKNSDNIASYYYPKGQSDDDIGVSALRGIGNKISNVEHVLETMYNKSTSIDDPQEKHVLNEKINKLESELKMLYAKKHYHLNLFGQKKFDL
ncbi:hypothetical protein I7104_003128 [Vibrio parahaemolyticus]|nr:hypothetical protein [Vibrio parahaemolyticus]